MNHYCKRHLISKPDRGGKTGNVVCEICNKFMGVYGKTKGKLVGFIRPGVVAEMVNSYDNAIREVLSTGTQTTLT